MGRIADFANSIRHSGARLGPLDVLFAGADYYGGKQEGEDDIRAAAGATGSTLGGWGGALAGGSAGAAIGSVVPVVGTAIGGAIGAIAGGTAGGFAGGWGADRVDETIRGNKQMQHYDRYGNFIGDDGTPEPDGVHSALNMAAGGTLAGAGIATARNAMKYGTNPAGVYNAAKGMGLTATEAANVTGRSLISDAGRALNRLPGWGKVLGGVALAYGADQMLGRPGEKLIDSVTGQTTNLDNDPVNRQKQQQLNQLQADQTINQQSNQLAYDSLKNDGTLRYFDEKNRQDRNEAEALNNRMFNRDTLEARRNSAYSVRAQAARDLLGGYMSNIPQAVAQSVQNVTNARF